MFKGGHPPAFCRQVIICTLRSGGDYNFQYNKKPPSGRSALGGFSFYKNREVDCHSTVTDFARFRGLSTSHSLSEAT